MRTLMKVCIDTEAGNRALRDGTLQQTIMSVADMIKPEAVYFTPENGKRTAYFFFDMKDSHLMPQVTEPLFMELKAEVTFTPVMNQEELQKGLQNMTSSKKK
ncbi:MAG: hypothetical protein ACM3Q2_19415 [Syntrophothermus sp.]